MSAELAAITQAGRALFARWENGDATEAEVAGGLWAFIDALSTPPADDVREALTRPLTGGERLTPDEAMQHAYAIAVTRAPGRMTWGEALRHFATWMREHDARLLAEVRPRGPVTDAEVDAAQAVIASLAPYGMELNADGSEDRLAAAYVEGVRDAHGTVRAALEAAREVHP